MDARFVVLKVTDHETGAETLEVVADERAAADFSNVAEGAAHAKASRLAFESRGSHLFLVARVVSRYFATVEVEREDAALALQGEPK